MTKRSKHSGGARYVFRSGYRAPKGIDVNQVAGTIGALYDEHKGRVTPKQLVDTARDESSPLHPLFEWSDTRAGELYRRWQARSMMRSIEVVTVPATVNHPAETQPIYIHVPTAKNGYYKNINDALTNADEWNAALRQVMAKRDAFEALLAHLKKRAEGSPDYADKAAALVVALESLAACRLALERAA